MKRYIYILWIMFVALLSGCDDNFDKGNSNPGEGVKEGMITFCFSTEEAPVIVTRANGSEQEESLENVLVMVFNKDGELLNKVYQQLTVDNYSVNIYLTSGPDQSIYALCNLPEGDETTTLIEKESITLSELKQQYTTILNPEGAYGGKHTMSGSIPLELTSNGLLKRVYTVPVRRLTAQLNFNVSFEPTKAGEQFAVGEMFLYNIPKGSMLLDGGGADSVEGDWGYHHKDNLLDSLDICAGDYSYVVATDKMNRSGQFFKEGKRLEFEIVKGEGTPDSYTSSFKMFENRQGRVYDHSDNWENLKGLIGRDDAEAQKYGYEDMYRYYQQINKRMKRCAKWEEWEIEKLKELKKSGVSSYTVIGNLLNNRHCDDVKNMWKKLIRKSLVSSRHNRNQTPKNQTVLRTVFRLAIVDHFHREALHSLRLQYRVHARLDEPTTTIVDDSLAHPSQLRIHRQELDLHGIQRQRVLVHHLHLLRTLRRLLLRRMLLALHRIPSPLLPYSSPSSSVVASSPSRPRRTPGWHFSPSPTSSSNTSRPTKLCHWQRWWQQVAIHTPSTSRPGAGPSFIAFSTHRIV